MNRCLVIITSNITKYHYCFRPQTTWTWICNPLQPLRLLLWQPTLQHLRCDQELRRLEDFTNRPKLFHVCFLLCTFWWSVVVKVKVLETILRAFHHKATILKGARKPLACFLQDSSAVIIKRRFPQGADRTNFQSDWFVTGIWLAWPYSAIIWLLTTTFVIVCLSSASLRCSSRFSSSLIWSVWSARRGQTKRKPMAKWHKKWHLPVLCLQIVSHLSQGHFLASRDHLCRWKKD